MSGYQSETTARIIDAIDRGLSDVPAPVYGQKHPCGRCVNWSTSGEYCDECRAFLLGDTETDPAGATTDTLTRTVTIDLDACRQMVNDSLTDLADLVAPLVPAISEAVSRLERELRPALRDAVESTPWWRPLLRRRRWAIYRSVFGEDR